MRIKKWLAVGAVTVLAVSLLAATASAHGQHHGGHHNTYRDSTIHLCTVDGCTQPGRHTHDGITYCGYDHGCGYCDGACLAQTGGHHGGHHGQRVRHCG